MSEEQDLKQNLSEVLFKPRRTSLETSVISNSGCPLPAVDFKVQSRFGFSRNWYRMVNRFYWTWLGGNLLDIEEALANVAVSQNKRTRPQCLDTVEAYGPGNWIYEFNAIAQKRVHLALQTEGEIRAHHLRLASRYFAIAAYPYLKGDDLAAEAALYSRRHYREVFEASSSCGYYSTESFLYQGHKIYTYLHSPDNYSLHPCVLVVCTYEQSCTDFFRFFNDYLRPLGIALSVIEMPGTGGCAHIRLDHKCSDFLKAAVDHLSSLPFIDSSSLGIYATGVAAMASLRLSLLNPGLIRAAVFSNPIIDNMFVNPEALQNVPLCLRSSFANRMDLDASSWDTVIPQVQFLSLRRQGLLSGAQRLQLPMLCFYLKDLNLTMEDAALIERTFRQAECRPIVNGAFGTGTFKFLQQTAEFFKKHLL